MREEPKRAESDPGWRDLQVDERLVDMWIRLRQIAVVAQDLRRTGLDIGTVLGVEPCFTDPGVAIFGLKNTLWPIGDQFLEVVTPVAEGTAGERYMRRRGGDSGYMVITQVDDVEQRRQRAAELGIRVAFHINHPTQGHDGIQLHPADTGGSLFEMDQMLGQPGDIEDGKWVPAGTNWKPYVRTDMVSAITAAELQSQDPESLAQRWAQMAEVELSTDSEGHLAVELDNAVLRFVPDSDGRGEGLGGIDVAAVNPEAILEGARTRNLPINGDQVIVGGLRINLRPPEAKA